MELDQYYETYAVHYFDNIAFQRNISYLKHLLTFNGPHSVT
jgi:hypothetical protein